MKKTEKTLNELIIFKIATLTANGQASTSKTYQTFLNYIQSHYGLVPISSVNPSFASRLKSDMQKESKSPSTIKTYFSLLIAVFNYAVYKKYAKQEDYPLRRKPYEIDKPKLDRPNKRTDCFLTKEEMQRIFEYWRYLGNTKIENTERRMIGLFLASYLGNGANLADILRWRWGKETDRITFTRHKVKDRTEAVITVPLIDPLAEVLTAIGSEHNRGGLVLPSFTKDCESEESLELRIMYLNTFVSKVLRRNAEKIGINPSITFGWARHSYCTILNSLGANYAQIERNMGHSIGIADNYFGGADIERLKDMNMMLL